MDAGRTIRITTVELIVHRAPIRQRVDPMVGVRIGLHEERLQKAARAEGGTWDRAAKVWRMPASVARALGMQDRIVEND